MADISTPTPLATAYLLSVPFFMPTNSGDQLAVSFAGNASIILAAALSVMVTQAFAELWRLICFFAMFFGGDESRRRYGSLAIIWNAKGDPWEAATGLVKYAFSGTRRSDRWFSLGFASLAFCVFGGGIAMGIVAPFLMLIGNVAPARPGAVSWPARPAGPSEAIQEVAIRAPAFLRALGSAEAARGTLRRKVSIERPTEDEVEEARHDNSTGLGPKSSVKYRYSLTGADMGLQRGSDLRLLVEGFCATEYSWVMDSKSANGPVDDQADHYQLWNDPNRTHSTLLQDAKYGPRADFILHPDFKAQWKKDSNASYAIIPDTARIPSHSPSDDPWYATESRSTSDRFDPDHQIKRQRPPLACWEKDSWSHAGSAVNSVMELAHTPTINIPLILLEIIEAAFYKGPMIYTLSMASGPSALQSRSTRVAGEINAEDCKMFDDMELLILASFVATKNIFADAAMTVLPDHTFNLARGMDGEPREGVGSFVLTTTTVQTFSLTGVASLSAVLGALALANLGVSASLRSHRGPREDDSDD